MKKSNYMIVEELMNRLDIRPEDLASLASISLRSIEDWKGLSSEDLQKTNKGSRLTRLLQVIQYIQEIDPQITPKKLMRILHDAEVRLDGSEDDESISLATFIQLYSDFPYWKGVVDRALLEKKLPWEVKE